MQCYAAARHNQVQCGYLDQGEWGRDQEDWVLLQHQQGQLTQVSEIIRLLLSMYKGWESIHVTYERLHILFPSYSRFCESCICVHAVACMSFAESFILIYDGNGKYS